jgi:uncharacterized protein (DUF427 family)
VRPIRLSGPIKRAAHVLRLHRISTRPSARHVEVYADGVRLAASDRAVELRETGAPARFYLPREDVRTDLLTPSPNRSHCPFKGDASYFSAGGAPDAFWVYESPSEPGARPIAGLLAPDPRRVDVRG